MRAQRLIGVPASIWGRGHKPTATSKYNLLSSIVKAYKYIMLFGGILINVQRENTNVTKVGWILYNKMYGTK